MFVTAGNGRAIPLILSATSEVVNSLSEKGAIVLVLVNSFGNLSSVYEPRIWPSSDDPDIKLVLGVLLRF